MGFCFNTFTMNCALALLNDPNLFIVFLVQIAKVFQLEILTGFWTSNTKLKWHLIESHLDLIDIYLS